MQSKLIVIEGTDCSGKETQTNMLMDRLIADGIPVKKYGFPMYDTPTGKIIGGPYLGKDYICEGWFPEKAPNVDSKVSSLYYAADRLYNIPKIMEELKHGTHIILDRYTYSNMAHQGGKKSTKEDRLEEFKWIEKLEFDFLKLPKPDIKIFLHMPTEFAKILKQNRKELPDQNEADENHLINAENAYIEMSKYYNFKTIECVQNNEIRTIEDINDELYKYVSKRKVKRR